MMRLESALKEVVYQIFLHCPEYISLTQFLGHVLLCFTHIMSQVRRQKRTMYVHSIALLDAFHIFRSVKAPARGDPAMTSFVDQRAIMTCLGGTDALSPGCVPGLQTQFPPANPRGLNGQKPHGAVPDVTCANTLRQLVPSTAQNGPP